MGSFKFLVFIMPLFLCSCSMEKNLGLEKTKYTVLEKQGKFARLAPYFYATVGVLAKIQDMKKIGGTTFKVLYTLVESVISEDPMLYASLQMSFPDIKNVEEMFLANTKNWASMVKNNDRQGFALKMNALREKLEKTDPSFQHAYENMYKITDGL